MHLVTAGELIPKGLWAAINSPTLGIKEERALLVQSCS